MTPVEASKKKNEGIVYFNLNGDTEPLSKPKFKVGRRGGLIVSALVSGSSGPSSSPGRGHCVVFLGKTLYSHSASLHPGV